MATVLLAGDRAAEIVGRLFRPASGQPFGAAALGRIVFGRWGDAPGEELVVCRRAEDQIEIHCHGGNAAVGAIVDALVSAGCQPARWQDWSRRQALSPVRADALEDLARATTLRAAAILLDQYQGALDDEITGLARMLAVAVGWDELASPTVAAGAMPQRSIPQKVGLAALGPPYKLSPPLLAPALHRIEVLIDRARLGSHLVEPFRVVLAGRPNAGKSSLINALLGYQRSIVHDQPGTTRDVVTAGAAFDGWPVELADTAGLRASGDALESAGIALAEQQLTAAQVQVLVFDASRPWTSEEQRLCQRWPDALVVHSKADLPRCGDRPAGISASALTPDGLDALVRAMVGRLAPEPPPAGAAVPFRASHVVALRQAVDACRRGDPAEAVRALYAL